MNAKEKRDYPRVQLNRPGRIRVGGAAETNTQLMDISENGAALFYSKPLPVKTEVELQFYLPIGERKATFTVRGRVCNYSVRGESHIVGVEFGEFIDGTAETIGEFVEYKREAMKVKFD